MVTLSPPVSDLPVRRLPVRFESDVRRVIVRPFVMSNSRMRALFDRLHALEENEVEDLLQQVEAASAIATRTSTPPSTSTSPSAPN